MQVSKPKIIIQVINPHKIGGTGTVYENLINSDLKEYFNLSPLVTKKTVPSISEIISLRKYFIAENPDLIEIQGANIEIFSIIIAAKLARKKVLMSVHGLYSDLYEINIIKKLFCKYITEPISFFLSDGVYTVCEFASKRKRIKVPTRNFFGHVYNVAPDYSIFNQTNDRESIRKELKIKIQDNIALYVGRITFDKGVSFLSEALVKLNKKWPQNFKFIIVGDGRYRSKMEKDLRQLIIDNKVFFTGAQNVVHHYYFASDFLVSPSLHENHSVTLLEACSAGIPSLATDVGGNPEIITNNFNGLLIPPLSSNELTNGIIQMLNLNGKWKEWGENSKYLAKNKFNIQKKHAKLKSIYDKVLQH